MNNTSYDEKKKSTCPKPLVNNTFAYDIKTVSVLITKLMLVA